MPMSRWDDLSFPFLGLAVVLAGAVAVGYLYYPDLFSIGRQLGLAYGLLLVGFALTYSYRPLRESPYGPLVMAVLIMLFAVHHYAIGVRGLLLPFGIFVFALAGFCYELYKLGSGRSRTGQVS
jgi:succinate dehydrogenase/fumarate reductase cytochrome b subunit